MLREEWHRLGFHTQWRQVVNSELFKTACGVILEEASRVRTPVNASAEMNALQNQFREGIYSAIHSFRFLSEEPKAQMKMPKPWERQIEEGKSIE